MTSRRSIAFVSALGAIAATVYAHPAHAASAEYVSLILDQTGSMLTPSGPMKDGVYTSTRWLESIKAAKSAIAANAKATTIAYGVWTFKQSADQNGAVQIWPLSSADCPTAANFETIGTNKFCKTNGQADFTTLTDKLDAIGADPAQTPQGDWLTPLADSLCAMMENISSSGISAKKTFVFESDAGENVSSSTCFGDPDLLAPAAWTYTSSADNEWGMSVDSWQAKVARKLYRFNKSLTNGAVVDNMANQVRLPTTTKSAYDAVLAAYNVAWNVDVHYELYPPAMAMAMAAPSAAASSSSLQLLAPQTITDVSYSALLQPAPAAASRASTTFAAVTAATSTPSIGANELNFFRALGKSTPRSKLREIVADPTTVYGVKHKRLGDVDDSGCTDQADLNIIKQQDVWLQRAVQPLQIAIRADVTRDGWVDKADKDLVVAHWAEGCRNPVRPPVL